jgi:hypothetical protein
MVRLSLAILSLAVLAGNSDPAVSPVCELHVWPAAATDTSSGGWLSNLGVAGALADYEHSKDDNLRDQLALIEGLSRPQQARLIADLRLPERLGMAGARVVFESAPLEPRSAAKSRTRQRHAMRS